MSDKTIIKTSKLIYPQIYAYILPEEAEKQGWIKIGYTERQDVDVRIKEQTHTAAKNMPYCKLWSDAAKYEGVDEWFKDIQFHAYLRRYKNRERLPRTEWFYYNGNPEKSHDDFIDFKKKVFTVDEEKHTYELRAEQEAAVKATLAYVKSHKNGEFLWNAKPRFGKTLTTYDFVRQLDADNILIVTNRPAIANSWFDDYQKFIAWQSDYKFVSTTDSLKNRPVMSRDEFLEQMINGGSKKMIAFISLQDLKGSVYFGGTHDKLKWVSGLEWDVLVIDEAHEGVETLKTDLAFENIKRPFTLYLSGTPFKALSSGQFSEEQIFNWTYTDEQMAKKVWSNREENREVNNPYEVLPQLNLFSYQMSQMITDEVNKGASIDGKNMDYAFDLNEFFSTKDDGEFVYERDVLKWLDTLTSNKKYPFSTPELRQELKHTFWILDRVASAKALASILKKHPVFENYKIVIAAGDGRSDDDQENNKKSLDKVRAAIKEKDRTITLSVGQLTTGVTIPEWTGVLILSNMKSAALYMQAAFRSQNPWSYYSKDDNVWYQKKNAYVFDFAPERTLMIYDEFANNLSAKTTNGGGTTDDRKEHIRALLNFFPVIAEDRDGQMTELDVDQVLTIPKSIKANEVVRRGFMSNLLFQNIAGIFASAGAREILEQLNPVEVGKVVPRVSDETIDTNGIEVDENGEVMVPPELVVAKTEAHFGDKVFDNIQNTVEHMITLPKNDIVVAVQTAFKENTEQATKDLAKEHGVTTRAAEQVVKKNLNVIAREVEVVQARASTKQKILDVELKREISKAHNDEQKIQEAKKVYEAKKEALMDEYQKEIRTAVSETTKTLIENTTEEIIKKAETKKKNIVEDDVRARLRGFARTIPSFLMAYGNKSTTLSTFDTTIKDQVFKEVTGITLEQFRVLRDTYNFFDQIVFDESVKEFLNKKAQLADYFDETQLEDIFDYIPPQQTNQIFTPKKVVTLMVDKLEAENPEIFSDSTKTFADLYMKSGLYITEIVKRLFKGLEKEIPDKNERLKHILEKQVYGFAPSEIIYNIARSYIFGFDEEAKNISQKHIVYLDTTPYAKGETEMTLEEKCEELFGGEHNEI